MRRRTFLRRSALVASGTVAITGPAAASHPDTRPAHVSLSFDETKLRRYRPILETSHLDERPTFYAWWATSSEYDTDCAVYFAHYTHQDGVTGRDSHYLDREPFYVFVDRHGDISEVVYSAFHWLAASTYDPPIHEDEDGPHPMARVVQRWHHYVLDGDETVKDNSFPDLANLHDKIDPWLETGWEENLRRGAVHNPWIMQTATNWWQENGFGFSGDAWVKQAWLTLGPILPFDFKGSDQTDL